MTIRIGIIGTGYFSMFHANIITKLAGGKLTSICGTSLEKAERMASNFTDVKGYDQLDDMLDAEQLDAVYICVPPMAHGKIELELIKRGIPFLVEKPLGNDVELPTTILEEIKKKPLITSVGYHYRYSESIAKLKELIKGQNIGIVLGQYMGDMPKVQWWRNQASSGGQFVEQTTHIVDLLRYICGEVDEVYSVFSNQILSSKDESVTVADVGTVTMKLRNGVVANISNTCILPESIGKSGITLFTDQGLFEWSPGKLVVTMKDSTSEYIDTVNAYEKESEAFIHAVRTGNASGILSDYEDSYKTHQVTSAALKSATEKSLIRL
ncbi:Gfo/Idh/MocA family protein [Sporosarcina sp. G11-34]|uniref:Gfo/Idh/MocA family protein n=1 Tax=Sporosarcina sp. G11-34 TaxID=2849605 RepID=UPI0022A9B7F2|nr:Gfo/Idh/MocA family oxidoreductase [Sporosarcina sp. G11-34]MCZ2258474.1 Gfo/Idh/MocA family oxidoreductase [Sporosarcina sp. G11-34]